MSTEPPKRILIVRFGAIGDIVLTLAAVQALKNEWPDTHITYLTKAHFADLLVSQPCIDEVMSLEPGESAASLRRRVHAAQIDGIIDLHTQLRSRALRLFNRIPSLGVKKPRGLWEASTVRLGWAKHNPKSQIIEEHHKIMDSAVGRPVKREKIQFHVSEAQSEVARKQLNSLGFDVSKPILGISPGANWFTKRWPIENFVEISKRAHAAGLQILALGSPAEQQLTHQLSLEGHALSLCNLPIGELGSIIQQTSIYLANDSGPMHIARGLQIPTVAIFGSTSPEQFDFDEHRYVSTHEDCSPCHFYGRKSCPKQHLHCLTNIRVDDVWESLRALHDSL
ncbi:MAG: glycosyltransferase family 9 protein [Deltaproteobacteria bacterium]|jgi:lipopolysaccharide heptosyltransferase II|nr:glycosyltransferase family 9 protein [Deltaproteobacteria bacterium]